MTRINAIHYGNLQLRSRKTFQQPTIVEILDELVKESIETAKTSSTPLEQNPASNQDKTLP